MEILKQGQYSPMKIEHQVAIIYCGTKELLRDVSTDKVKEFEADFLEIMEIQYRTVLDELEQGKLSAETEDVIRKVASEVAEKYKN